jgi:hypothetical protein
MPNNPFLCPDVGYTSLGESSTVVLRTSSNSNAAIRGGDGYCGGRSLTERAAENVCIPRITGRISAPLVRWSLAIGCSQSFHSRIVTQWQCAAALLDVVVWAEHGVVPFKAELGRVSEEQENELWGYRDENGVGLAAMIEVYEARLAEAQPYLYCNFGI